MNAIDTHWSAMNPRQRRLAADFAAIRGEFSGHEHITVEPVGANPPDVYRITYRVRGLRLEGDQPVTAEEHVCEVRLPLGYPREQPYVVPITPVFHPNIAAHYCVGDYWSAGQPLADIIRKIGDMLQYRIYNVRAPLDALAAKWTAENEALLPIGDVDLGSPDPLVERITGTGTAATAPAAPAEGRRRLEVEV
jgi:ubiquitin-protein ligase